MDTEHPFQFIQEEWKEPGKEQSAWNNNELASPVPKSLAALNMVNMASCALQILDRVYVYILLIIRVEKIVKIFSKHRKNLKKKNRKIVGESFCRKIK